MIRLTSVRVCSVFLPVLIVLVHTGTTRGQQLIRQGHASAGAISEVAVTGVDEGLIVTAVRNGDHNLQLITWSVSGDPQRNTSGAQYIVRKGSKVYPATMDHIAISSMGKRRVVTAGRDGSGNLKLILWKISQDGQNIEQGVEVSSEAISEVDIAFVDGSHFLTAIRTNNGRLKLTHWEISVNDSHLIRLEDAYAGWIKQLALLSTGSTVSLKGVVKHLVTAVIVKGNNLKLIAWSITKNGLQRGGEAPAVGVFSSVDADSIARLSDPGSTNERDIVLTAGHDSGGNLRLIAWSVARCKGQPVVRMGDASAGGAISKVTVARVDTPQLPARLITAVRSNGNLSLDTWDVDSGQTIVKKGHASAGTVSDIAVVTPWLYYLVTAVCDSNGNLKLIGWKHSGP